MNTNKKLSDNKQDTSHPSPLGEVPGIRLLDEFPSSVRLFLFDMDGVLYNSMPNHVIAWQESMKSFDLEMSVDDVYATEGMRGVETIQRMVKEQQQRIIDEEEALRMYNEKARIFATLPEAPVMEGVMEVMNKIQQADMLIGVVTGSAQRPLLERLEQDFGMFVPSHRVVSAFDVSRGKPAPDPYLMGLKKAGDIPATEAVVVENAPMGVRAGVAAGIFTVAVNSGPLLNSVLAGEGAHIVFDDMPQFRDNWDELFLKR